MKAKTKVKTKAQKLREWRREKRKVPQWVKDEERKAAQHLRSIMGANYRGADKAG